jgi:hypothetical protein
MSVGDDVLIVEGLDPPETSNERWSNERWLKSITETARRASP